MSRICVKLCATDHRDSLWKGDYYRRILNSQRPAWRVSLFPTHLLLAFLLTAVTLAPALGSAADAKPEKANAKPKFMFGQMFPKLPQYAAPDDTALTVLTAAGPTIAPGPLFDTNISAPVEPNDDNPNNVPSFFTYFGQFLDHDMTLDTLPLPTTFVDPNTIQNFRDPRLNLDSVYGGGP